MKYLFGIIFTFFSLLALFTLYILLMYSVTNTDEITLLLDIIFLVKNGALFIGSTVALLLTYRVFTNTIKTDK